MTKIVATPVAPEPTFVEIARAADPSKDFVVVAECRDPDGVVGVVTERISDGRISFGFFREFEQNKQTKRSTFLAHRHIPAVRRILAELDKRLEQIEDRARASRRMAG